MEHGGFGVRGSRVGAGAGAKHVGLTVYELDPGKRNLPYHAHFGVEEVVVVSAQGGEWGTEDAVAYMLSTESQLEYFEGEPE